jgi:hypothetical protein
VELVEGILKGNSEQLESSLSPGVRSKMSRYNDSHEVENPPSISVDSVYTELIHLRKMNKALEDRIKHLEVKNFRMTSQGFNMDAQEEPNRPIFSGQQANLKDSNTAPTRNQYTDTFQTAESNQRHYATLYSNRSNIPIRVLRSGVQ